MNINPERSVDGFVKAVETALTHYQDPIWLNSQSPLAAPYFLGHLLDRNEPEDKEHQYGYALQSALRNAAANLNQEQRELLNVAFFNRKSSLDNVGVAMALHMSERTFYRNKNKTVQALAQNLNQSLMPPLQPEAPVYQEMIGRRDVLSSSLAALAAGSSVYITGASGTGKTTLGAAISRAWNQMLAVNGNQISENRSYTFWYTIRPDFNDYVANFVFTLGYFLRRHGAYYTWQQLVADQGKIQIERIVGLLRYDLETLSGARFLFCIDDVDLLESESVEHVQIINLLEELGKLTPLLLIGQRAIIDVNTFHTLPGFDAVEMAEYLNHVGLKQQDEQVQHLLLQRTNGNPTLLALLNAFNKLGGDIDQGLKALADAPSVEALYIRIWRRLNNEERHLLLQLIVFRNPAPLDAWAEDLNVLERLRQYGLVQSSDLGAVFVMPHIRKIGYLRTPAELKPLLHQRAAKIREERNSVLSAMHHYIAAHQPALAVWLWYTNRTTEVERGGGFSALSLLQTISATELEDKRDRNALLVARGQLYKLKGQPEEAAADLAHIILPKKGTFAAYVQQLQAQVLEMQGLAEQALAKYRTALEALTGSQNQREVTIRTRIGFLHEFNFQEREDARREALLARIKAEGFHGGIEEMAGNYKAARERYQAAHDIAQQLGENDNAALSQVYSQLGILTLREGQIESAIELIERAIEHDQKRGDVVSPLYDVLNLAYAHTLAKNYDKAFEVAYGGLQTAQRLGLSYLIAGLACGVGEACCSLGRLEEAEQYGRLSLDQEEGYFRSWALALLGVVRSQQGNFNEAEQLLNEAIASAKYAEDKYGEAHCWHMLANVFHAIEQVDRARDAFETSLALYQELDLAYKIDEIQGHLQSLILQKV